MVYRGAGGLSPAARTEVRLCIPYHGEPTNGKHKSLNLYKIFLHFVKNCDKIKKSSKARLKEVEFSTVKYWAVMSLPLYDVCRERR